jgi:hypothetical protein
MNTLKHILSNFSEPKNYIRVNQWGDVLYYYFVCFTLSLGSGFYRYVSKPKKVCGHEDASATLLSTFGASDPLELL